MAASASPALSSLDAENKTIFAEVHTVRKNNSSKRFANSIKQGKGDSSSNISGTDLFCVQSRGLKSDLKYSLQIAPMSSWSGVELNKG